MAEEKFIIINSKYLLDPQSDTEKNSELDLPLNGEYLPYAQGYLRLLSDLATNGYKIVFVIEYKAGKEVSGLEKLFEHLDKFGISCPNIHAKIFYKTHKLNIAKHVEPPESLMKIKETLKKDCEVFWANYYPSEANNMREAICEGLGLNFSEPSAQAQDCIVFCDQEFSNNDFEDCQKFQRHWNFETFFHLLCEVYLNSSSTPQNVFSKLLMYSEYVVDHSEKIFFPDVVPLEDISPNDVLAKLDKVGLSFASISGEQWSQLNEMKEWVEEGVFLSQKITGINEVELNGFTCKQKSAYQNIRPERESFSEKSDELDNLLKSFMPGYTSQLEALLPKLRKSSDSLRSRGHHAFSEVVDDLYKHIHREHYWLSEFYNHFEDRPFVRLYGLLSCVEESLDYIKDFIDNNKANDQMLDEGLCAWDIIKNIGFFFLTALTVIPLAIHAIMYAVQVKEDKRTTFLFFTPQNELIKLEKAVKEVVEMPTHGIEVR